MIDDPVDPLCLRCGLRAHSDCVCTLRDPVYRSGAPQFERAMRAPTRGTIDTHLQEAERLAATGRRP